MVVVSLVETARSERLKKHVFIPGEDEYQCSSGPLNGKTRAVGPGRIASRFTKLNTAGKYGKQ